MRHPELAEGSSSAVDPSMSERSAFVYILTNSAKTVLYIGVTTDLVRRMEEHIEKTVPGFSSKYNCNRLIYFEESNYVSGAIDREKQLKGWRREKKEKLIAIMNPDWIDLSESLYDSLEDPSAAAVTIQQPSLRMTQ